MKNAGYIQYQLIAPDGLTSSEGQVTKAEAEAIWAKASPHIFEEDVSIKAILAKVSNEVNQLAAEDKMQIQWKNQAPGKNMLIPSDKDVAQQQVSTILDEYYQQQEMAGVKAYEQYRQQVAQGQPAWLDLVEYQTDTSYQIGGQYAKKPFNWNRLMYDGQKEVLYHYQLEESNIFADTYNPTEAYDLPQGWTLKEALAYGRDIEAIPYQSPAEVTLEVKLRPLTQAEYREVGVAGIDNPTINDFSKLTVTLNVDHITSPARKITFETSQIKAVLTPDIYWYGQGSSQDNDNEDFAYYHQEAVLFTRNVSEDELRRRLDQVTCTIDCGLDMRGEKAVYNYALGSLLNK